MNWGGNQDSFLQGWSIRWGEDWGTTTTTGWRSRQSTADDEHHLPAGGTLTDNKPFPLRESVFSGTVGHGYEEDFYNRILQEPALIEFGQVATEQSLDFTVWNAYLNNPFKGWGLNWGNDWGGSIRTIELTNVIETDFDSGTTFSGQSVPSSFNPLEERTYQITVVPDGPPTIDAEITFDWETGIDNTTSEITGTRVLFLPFIPRSGMTESLEWKTDILNSWNGTEQRVRQRLSPRQRFTLESYLPRSNMQRIDNLLYRSREQAWVMGIWGESREGSAITQNDTVFNVSTLYGDFRIDSLMLVWESETKYDILQISAKTDTTITSTSGISQSYSSPIIMPVRSVRILGNPTRTTSGFNAILRLNVEVTDNVTLTTSPSTQQYNSTDTWFEEPLAISAEGSPDSYQHRIQLIDYELGKIEQFAPWDNIRIGRTIEFIFEGQQEIWEFREWLHRRSGRLVPFYQPTFENNFKISNTGTIGNTITAEDWDYDYDLSGRDNIVFRLADGTWEPRQITSSTTGSGTVTVVFTPVLNELASDVIEVSFFGLKRLASDAITLTWLPNDVLRVTLSILEIAP